MITPIAYLEARDPERNIHRAYSIAYGRDLFGNWIVETTYGRIGGKDSIQNTIALCPSCHRKMHVLDRHEDKE